MAWGMLSIIPLLSAIIINFGLMGFSGIYLSHVTALLSSVIIGVGVDFSTIYITLKLIAPKINQTKTQPKHSMKLVIQ